MYVAVLDVKFAFDSVMHEATCKACSTMNVPAWGKRAAMRDLTEKRATIKVPGAGECEPFFSLRG